MHGFITLSDGTSYDKFSIVHNLYYNMLCIKGVKSCFLCHGIFVLFQLLLILTYYRICVGGNNTNIILQVDQCIYCHAFITDVQIPVSISVVTFLIKYMCVHLLHHTRSASVL